MSGNHPKGCLQSVVVASCGRCGQRQDFGAVLWRAAKTNAGSLGWKTHNPFGLICPACAKQVVAAKSMTFIPGRKFGKLGGGR